MNELEQLESRLSQIRAPQMPSDMEARIRQRLSAQTAKPPKVGPLAWLASFFPPSPAFAAQIAVFIALVVLAVALFMHDAALGGASAMPAPANTGTPGVQAPNYQVTFSVPTLSNGKAAAPGIAPMIAPPPAPRHHHP